MGKMYWVCIEVYKQSANPLGEKRNTLQEAVWDARSAEIYSVFREQPKKRYYIDWGKWGNG